MHSEDKKKEIAALIEERECMDAEEQASEVVRIMHRIHQVDVPGAFLKVSNRLPGDDRWRLYFRYLSRVAAILFLPLLLFVIWQYEFSPGNISRDQASMQQITSPPGTRSQLVLSDGSKVWLNAGSTLRVPIPFSRKTRNVSLIGQAFFEVQKNPDVPFVVQTDNVTVKVTGTEFDVNAYPENEEVAVVLARGKISVTAGNRKNTIPKSALLQPGDRAVVGRRSGDIQLSKGDVDKYTAWRTGRLVFDETPMSEVARQLERWYGIRVVIQDPDILRYHFSTTFENEPLFQVLELLKLSSPIEIECQPARYDHGRESYTKSIVYIKKKTNSICP